MTLFFQNLAFIAFAATGMVLFNIEKASISYFYISILLLFLVFFIEKTLSAEKVNIKKKIANDKIWLILLTVTISYLLNFQVGKLTSIIYAFSWIGVYILILILFKGMSIYQLVNILKCILIFNFIWLLIGEYYIILNLSDVNETFTVLSPGDEIQRPRGIATEPSYSTYISAICFLSLSTLGESKFKWFFIYFFSIVIAQSSFGYIFLMVIVGGFVFRRYFTKKLFLVSFFLLFVILSFTIYISYEMEIIEVKRAFQPLEILFFEKGTILDKIEVLKSVDASAFWRIGPIVIYWMDVSLFDINFYLGHGAGLSGGFFGLIFNKNEDLDLGLIPGFLYEYGLVTTIIVLIFIYQKIKKLPVEFKILVLLFITNASFSTQILWFSIILFSMTQYFKSGKINIM